MTLKPLWLIVEGDDDDSFASAMRLPDGEFWVGTDAKCHLVLPDGAVRPSGRHHTNPFYDTLNSEESPVLDGAWLAQAGLPMPRVQAETALLVHLQKVVQP